MSGTSLDGLDIALCQFALQDRQWTYTIIRAEIIPFSPSWKKRLQSLDHQDALALTKADWEFGYYAGDLIHQFLQPNDPLPTLVASHGQTIFHQPANGFTLQIGKGAAIAAKTGIPVVCDFRAADVALGGQGAPLVPIGDALLFPQYTYCLNIGGFTNISYANQSQRVAFDIAPANIALNFLTRKIGREMDENGHIASTGTLIPSLLNQLNDLEFYHQPPPKSLGKEWFDATIIPLLDNPLLENNPIPDLLATYCEHIAIQVARHTGNDRVNKLLITGGGAYNAYLINRIRYHATAEIIIPDRLTIDFKEALIFGFIGLLRWRNEINCLSSVTGASRDTIGGAIYR